MWTEGTDQLQAGRAFRGSDASSLRIVGVGAGGPCRGRVREHLGLRHRAGDVGFDRQRVSDRHRHLALQEQARRSFQTAMGMFTAG